jgi:hypothetical protein
VDAPPCNLTSSAPIHAIADLGFGSSRAAKATEAATAAPRRIAGAPTHSYLFSEWGKRCGAR